MNEKPKKLELAIGWIREEENPMTSLVNTTSNTKRWLDRLLSGPALPGEKIPDMGVWRKKKKRIRKIQQESRRRNRPNRRGRRGRKN